MVHKKSSTTKPLTLSLVIPAYNEEHHLKACLDAISAQITMPDEVLVVDNNSTDQTMAVAKQYPFVIILREPKQGVIYARDSGFNAASSDIIGRIDSDTILPPTWVAAVKQALRNPNFAAVTGPVAYYDMPWPRTNYWIDHKIRKYLYHGAPKAPFLFGSNMAIRYDAWDKVKIQICHKRSMHEDLDLAVHLQQIGYKILYNKSLLASTSARRYDDKLPQFRRYMSMYLYTYKHHRIKSLAPRVATTFYWLGYILLNPVRRSYDPLTGKHSLRQLRQGHVARKNPMSG